MDSRTNKELVDSKIERIYSWPHLYMKLKEKNQLYIFKYTNLTVNIRIKMDKMSINKRPKKDIREEKIWNFMNIQFMSLLKSLKKGK